MLIEERHKEILEILHKEGRIKAREIEEKFGIGFDTARRDLRILEGKGLLKRTYGGAIPIVQVGYTTPNTHTPRDITDIKSNYLAISQEAVKLIKKNYVVFLTGGSVGFFIAQNLPNDLEFTVATNSIIIADELRKYNKISIFMIGGLMNKKGHTGNHFAVEMIKSMHFDIAFLTAAAYSVEFGMSIQNSEVIPIYKALLDNSRKCVGLFPHEKMGNASILKVCNPDALSIVITDWDTTKEDIYGMKDLGVEVIVADQHEVIYKKLKARGYKGWGGERYEQRMEGWEKKFDLLFDAVKLENGNILELGCGAGDATIRLAEMGHNMTGVDISQSAIEWAKEKAKKLSLDIDFIANSVCEPNLLEGREFDLVMDGCCLHCLFDEDRKAFYKNVKQLMKDDGYFFINSAILTNAGDPIPRLSSIERCVVTQEELEKELQETGFKKLQAWVNRNKKHSHYFAVYTKN